MSEPARAFLVLNAGSSSLKFGLYAADDLAALCRGGIEAIGLGATWGVKGAFADRFDQAPPLPEDESHATNFDWLLHALQTCLPRNKVVVLHLMREKGLSVAEVDELLNQRSGLLGVSGLSDDVRDLEASEDPNAAEALDLFAYRAARELGSLVAALGGIDALVFTAGIGEHSASMRARICRLSAWTGLVLDDVANAAHQTRISTPGSRVGAFVIPTDEEIVIARALRTLGL
jgi:acetate kinase